MRTTGRRLTPLLLLLPGLFLGFWGIGWGLPSRERLAAVLPPGLDGPAWHERMSRSWSELHARLGPNLMINPASFDSFSGVLRVPAGWKEPPELMVSSYRSFYVRSAHEDEQTALLTLSRMKPKQLDFHPHMFTYGGAYLYTLGVWEAAGAALGRVTLKRSLSAYLADPALMAGLYLWGRLLSVAAYLAVALLLMRIGRRHLGEEAGALAALLWLLSPAAVVQAHVLKNHVFWAVFAVLTLERCLALLEKGGYRRYALAGAAAGLAVGSFLMAWPACVMIAACAVLRAALRRGRPLDEARGLALAAAASFAAFLLTNPYWALDLAEARAELKPIGALSTFGWDHPWLFLWNPFRRSFTTPVFALLLAGAGWAAVRGRRDPKLLLTLLGFACGLGFTFMAHVGPTRNVRYGLGWAAIGLLLAARVLVDLVKASGPRVRHAALVLAALVVVHAGAAGLSYARNFRLEQTPRSNKTQAGEWIAGNVPAGETIGLLRLPQPSNAPYFRYDRYELRLIEPARFNGLAPKDRPRWLVLAMLDFDDRPKLRPGLAEYERAAVFERPRLFPWIAIDPTSTTANPVIEIYRLP